LLDHQKLQKDFSGNMDDVTPILRFALLTLSMYFPKSHKEVISRWRGTPEVEDTWRYIDIIIFTGNMNTPTHLPEIKAAALCAY